MRVLGIPVVGPRTAVRRVASDIAAIERLVRSLPDQLERGLTIGEELVVIGRQLLALGERLDQRTVKLGEIRASDLAGPIGGALDTFGRLVGGFPPSGAARRPPSSPPRRPPAPPRSNGPVVPAPPDGVVPTASDTEPADEKPPETSASS
jgi:hypothetical protein